jgi:hypothetical protein
MILKKVKNSLRPSEYIAPRCRSIPPKCRTKAPELIEEAVLSFIIRAQWPSNIVWLILDVISMNGGVT